MYTATQYQTPSIPIQIFLVLDNKPKKVSLSVDGSLDYWRVYVGTLFDLYLTRTINWIEFFFFGTSHSFSEAVHHSLRVRGNQFRRRSRPSKLLCLPGRRSFENHLEFSWGKFVLTCRHVHVSYWRTDQFVNHRFADGCSFWQLHVYG